MLCKNYVSLKKVTEILVLDERLDIIYCQIKFTWTSSGSYRYEHLYVCTEDTNFKTFLKKYCGTVLESYSILNKKMLDMEMNMMLVSAYGV